MPTILRIRGYRFFFFSMEGLEPPHIHVARAESYAKFWIDPPELADNRNFRSDELKELLEIVTKHRDFIRSKWNEHFGH